jgi:hypothetical protein
MGFKAPAETPLSEAQEKLLAQMAAVKSLLTIKKRKFNVPESKQISLFDYLVRLLKATIGPAVLDILLKKFMDKLFDPNNDKLERMVIKAMAKSLDAQGKTISNGTSNHDWLIANILPGMNVAFRVLKGLIVRQIIVMMFGPKESMVPKKPGAGGLVNGDESATGMLNAACCSEAMFSLSNSDDDMDGDMEYNVVELRKRLEKGQMIFTISCQDVKVELPKNIEQFVGDIVANNMTPGAKPTNPTSAFYMVNNHVTTESQRINSEENKNAVNKTFLQIMIEKIFNLITSAIAPFMGPFMQSINQANPSLQLTTNDVLGSPCEVRDLCQSADKAHAEKRKKFMTVLINSMYAMLCSIILAKLLKEVKKMIKQALAQRQMDKAIRKMEKLKLRAKFLDQAGDALEKAAAIKSALADFDDVFKYQG